MSKVEVIYIHKNKKTNTDNLKPSVRINNKNDTNNTIRTYNKPNNQYKPQKRKKGPMNYISIFIVLIILIAAFSTTYNAGYVPINPFLEIKEPAGNAREISYMQIKEKYPIVDSIPEIKTVKHELFGTDETITNIAREYKKDLSNDGFKLKYSGSTELKGINVHYYGFIKGITAAVILMTSDDVGVANTETIVLYSIDNIFSYKSIIDKYSNHFNF